MRTLMLSRFTPSLMDPETLEAIFVQREPLAERLVALVRDSALTATKHHALLVGPRGVGKTHLLTIVQHRIRKMDDLASRLVIAWLREEEWGITSFLDLLLRIFRALPAECCGEGLDERVEALFTMPPDAAERAAGKILAEAVAGRTLLILMENLDEVFSGLGTQGQKRLRSYLQEHPFCTLVATAQRLFGGVSLRTSPFYGFFRTYHLDDLSFEDATHLLVRIAEHAEDRALASFIRTPKGRARVRAVHHLAGGNHRVFVTFSQFLSEEALDALVEPLMHTLDELTPYYQARMQWLSPQQRKIVEFLCDRRHAVPVKEIANRCFITPPTAASQLKDLRDKGYVCATPLGREAYYELREPLMRMCMDVKKHRGGPIPLLVEFLRLWYCPTELEHLAQDPTRTAALDEALERFGDDTKHVAGHTRPIVNGLIPTATTPDVLRTRVGVLVRTYDQHSALAALGQALVQSIPAVMAPVHSDVAARNWLAAWEEHTAAHTEFQIPRRLLDAAVRYREGRNPRALLELPVEERSLLEPLVTQGEEIDPERAPATPRAPGRAARS